jgi:hypothetical protein
VKGYLSTGDAIRGLGTDHESIEPGLLLYQRLSDRLAINAEVRYWISIDGSDFAGDILRYGIGASYDLARGCDWKLTPTIEFVGWSVLSGKESSIPNPIIDASGFFFGDHSSIAATYGRALTGTVWYKDIYRLEYRWQF